LEFWICFEFRISDLVLDVKATFRYSIFMLDAIKLHQSTKLNPQAIVCMDGRIRPNGLERPFLGLAGSGVLFSDAQITKFKQNLLNHGVNPATLTVTWHEHCGACAVYKERTGDKRSQDEIAQWSAQKLADGIGSTMPVKSIGWSEDYDYKANGDPHKHSEPCIVIDYTGKLDTKAAAVDDSFLLSHAYAPDAEWQKEELEIALSIAMGDHGPGLEHFTANPMPVYLIGADLDKHEETLQPVLEKFPAAELTKINL
jgi:hypothetical protein